LPGEDFHLSERARFQARARQVFYLPAAEDQILQLSDLKLVCSGHFKSQTFVDKFTPPGVTQTIPTRERVWNFLGGIPLKSNSRVACIKPFGHVLAGVAHYTDRQSQVLDLFPQFNFTAGVGIVIH